MIKLNADESMLLLILKGHEHKEVPRPENGSYMCEGYEDYLDAVLRHRCYGDSNSKFYIDKFNIFRSLAEKLLSKRELICCLDNCQEGQFHQMTPAQSIMSALRMVMVKENGERLISFDLKYIKEKEGFEYE